MRSTVAALLAKELTLEWRTRESVPAMVLFSIATYVIFHFGLDRDRVAGDLASGVLWVTLLFAAILGVNRLFVAEYEQGGFDGFLLAPVDRTALLVAKALALFLFLGIVEVVAVPTFALLLLDEPLANLDPAAGAQVAPLIGAQSGATRVVTSHDPAGGLLGADVALGLKGGRVALLAPAAQVTAQQVAGLYA